MITPIEEEFEQLLLCRHNIIWDESARDHIEPGDVSEYFQQGFCEGIILMHETPTAGRNVLTEKSPQAINRLLKGFLEKNGYEFYPTECKMYDLQTWEIDHSTMTSGFAVMNISEEEGIKIAEKFGLHFVIVFFLDPDVRVEAIGLKRFKGLRMTIFKCED